MNFPQPQSQSKPKPNNKNERPPTHVGLLESLDKDSGVEVKIEVWVPKDHNETTMDLRFTVISEHRMERVGWCMVPCSYVFNPENLIDREATGEAAVPA